MGTPHDRTGRPEIDDLLDLANAEQRTLEEISAVNRAENVVADVRHAELADAHQALCRRCEGAHAELEAAEAVGDPARIAAAGAVARPVRRGLDRPQPGIVNHARRRRRAKPY